MTKPIHDVLSLDDIKVEVAPTLINPAITISAPHLTHKPKGKVKVRATKAKVAPRRTRLDRATSQLYDLEAHAAPEKTLNIDFGLYQMEDY